MSTVPAHATHGELKRRLARHLGTDASRYATGTGTERHKRLTAAELERLCEVLGIGFIDAPKQQKRDTIMIRLGRDHRTGARMWDSSDLRAVLEELEEDP